MENKYYVPTLDEFYVGFEYDDFNPKDESMCGTWKNNIFEADDYKWLVNYKYIKYENLIRVKYLDKSDIESTPLPHDYYYVYNKSNDVQSNISIYRIIDNKNHCVFDGYIKNRNELKKILKLIGINEEK